MTYNAQYSALLPCPHLLVGGATGSGKSVFLHGFLRTITALQADSGLVLIDPKRVELAQWRGSRVDMAYATELPDILYRLDQAIALMEQRYKQMQRRRLTEWTKQDVYVVIDELADLMLTDPLRVRPRLQRLLQLGRAANIHIVAATQAPSRKVIPAELTLNFTHKLALRCDSAIESRQLIGIPGAESLPLYGTGIIRMPGDLYRIPIPYVSPAEIADHVAELNTKRI